MLFAFWCTLCCYLNHLKPYHNSSFLKLFLHGFDWYREFDWQLTATLNRVDWRDDWHMYLILVSCISVFHFLPFCRRFSAILWHSVVVKEKKLKISWRKIFSCSVKTPAYLSREAQVSVNVLSLLLARVNSILMTYLTENVLVLLND